ncbi:MAG: copper-binding protein [Gemmataceae bacterium]|nr:copper-binding protein [Gemmataceae bacterium]
MRTLIRAAVVLAAALALVAGCQKAAEPGKDKDADKVYDLRGTVVATNPGKKIVTLDHEDIPGLMKGMRMEFAVADAKLLDGLQPGDAVEGKLKVGAGNSYLVTDLRKK